MNCITNKRGQDARAPVGDQIALISRAVFLQLLRKRDLYIVFFLMSLFAVGALFVDVVGIENAATATFLLNLGLTLAWYCAHILTLVLAAGQLPSEIENRTLYPLLAKPVSRGTVLFGKWLACSLCGSGVWFALALMGWLPVPKREVFDGFMLVQLFVLQFFSLAMLSALAITLSLVFTRGVTLVVLGILLVLGSQCTSFIDRVIHGGVARSVAHWMVLYMPDFTKLNLITRYTDGVAALGMAQCGGLMLYAAIFTAASLALGMRIFQRRPL